MQRAVRRILILSAGVALPLSFAAYAAGEVGRYQTRAEFLLESFGTEQPPTAVVWLDDELRQTATRVLGHPPAMLRVRYWYDGAKTAWIIDEIGKEQAITFGIVIENAAIQALRVMEFRESRGWEIRYPFFTAQFAALQLNDRGALSRGIDGISGATLSVKAATRSATLALVLDEFTRRPKQQSNAAR